MKLGLVVPTLLNYQPSTTDGPQFLTVPSMDICSWAFTDSVWTGGGGLNDSGVAANTLIGTAGHLTVPMLVGPQSGTPLTNSGSGQTTSPQNPSNATTPTTMTMADVASGVWDAMFTTGFTLIAASRPNCILRIGHENYGNGWYPWCGAALSTLHTACFQHLVTLARTVSSSFKFDWNGAQNYTGYDPMTASGAYPGDSYVDYISADWYDGLGFTAGTWMNGGAAGWNAAVTQYLVEGLAFAIAHGKPFCIPEFGLGQTTYNPSGGLPEDDPNWVKAAYTWMRANEANLGYVLYFQNEGGSNPGSLNLNPQSAAVFAQLFGAWARQNAGISNRFTSANGRSRIT